MTDEKKWVHTKDPLAAILYDLIRDFIPSQETVEELIKTNHVPGLDGYQLEERPDGLAAFSVRMADLIHQQAEEVAKTTVLERQKNAEGRLRREVES